jgi:hypothetical protein
MTENKFNYIAEILSRYDKIIENQNLKSIQKTKDCIKITIDYNNPNSNNKVTIVHFDLRFEKNKINYTNDELDMISKDISNQQVIEKGGPKLFLLIKLKYLLNYIIRLDNIIENSISKSKQLVILLIFEEENNSRINTILKSYKRLTYNSYRLGEAKDTKTLKQKEEEKGRKIVENELETIVNSMNKLNIDEEHKEVFSNLNTLAKIDKSHSNMVRSIEENNLISDELKINLKNQLIHNFKFIEQTISTNGVVVKVKKENTQKNKKSVKNEKKQEFSNENPYLNISKNQNNVVDVEMSETDHDSDGSNNTETESSTSHIKKEIVQPFSLNLETY